MTQRKTTFITVAGAGSPLGQSIARAFAAAGFNIAVTGRNKGRVSQAAKELAQEYGVEALPLALDTSTGDLGQLEQNCQAAIVAAAEHFGRIDVLVNASQAAKAGELLQSCKAKDLQLALSSGLCCAAFLMAAAHPHLKASAGCVINLLSASAASGQEGLSTLAASKEGLRGLSRVAAKEWEPDNIAIHCLEPQVSTKAHEQWAAEYADAAVALTDEQTNELVAPEAFAQHCVELVLGRA